MGKYVVTENGFCTIHGIVTFATKGVNARYITKKRWHWPNSVPGDIINHNFVEKEVGDVDMSESATEDGKPFRIFLFKEPEYVMNIMASWTTIDEL